MKSTRVIITHTLVAACVWLIVAKRGALSSPQAETEQPNGNAANSVTSSTRQAAKERNTRSWAISDYQKAWADLPGLKLNKADRRMMQRKILQGWAEKDLEGALRAAFADHVQDASMLTSGSERLTKIFGESIIQRTDDYWQLIQSGKLGILNTEILSAVWVNCLGIRDATILKPYIAELKGNTFAFAIMSLQRDGGGKISSSELMSALELREKNGLWQPRDEHVLMDTMKTWFSGEEMRALLSRTTPHLQKAITKSLAAEYSSHPDQPWQETIVSIPESLRASFADGVMSISPINRGLNPQESAIKKEAIDYLVAQQQWTILEASGADDAVRELARSTDPKQLAEWSAALPPRKETTEMFHRGVESYIRNTPEQAWQWVQELPAGYWRDRALAEYSQQSLHHHKNPEWSRTAIDQIADPSYRQTVEGWRSDWESQKP